jgi:hypothetical protein
VPLEIRWFRHLRRLAMGRAVLSLALALQSLYFASQTSNRVETPHNVIIFVAAGLRAGSLNKRNTPALWAVRTQGVHFANSHGLPRLRITPIF